MVVDWTNTALLLVVSIALPMTTSSQVFESGDFMAGGWEYHVVDYGYYVGTKNYITVDDSGHPHISYFNYQTYEIRYASWDGSKWNIDIVDDIGHMGGYISHDLDSRGFPHIAYFDTHWGMKYAKWDGTDWDIVVVDSETEFGTAALAIDANDNPHIGYGKSDHLMHTYWDGAGWNTSEVDDRIEKYSMSIDIDSKGLPHMSYCAAEDYGNWALLHHATWDGASWNIEVPDTVTRACHDKTSSIAVDSQDRPHISYIDHTTEDLKYAYRDGSSWLLDTVDTNGRISDPTSIAVDSQDKPHIAYAEAREVRYAVWDGGEWNIERVESVSFPSLALDQDDAPHISYYAGALGYATKPPPPPVRSVSLGIDPDTLNLKSEGKWITAYIATENATARDINPLSLLLNDFLKPAWWDIQNETTLMAKFSRSAVQTIVPISDEVDIEVTGRWKDGEAFEMHDTIRVIGPGNYREKPESFSTIYLEQPCLRENWQSHVHKVRYVERIRFDPSLYSALDSGTLRPL